MNRRTFAQNLAAAALVTLGSRSSVARSAEPMMGEVEASNAPFKISVMLWTVLRELPIEQWLEKVAEAGYSNVELVAEHKKWSADEFKRANAWRQELGITLMRPLD